jgi:hypothetical protein
MELLNLFIFLGFTYLIRLFNYYQIIFYLLVFSISLQITVNENQKFIEYSIEQTKKYKTELLEKYSKYKLIQQVEFIYTKTNELYIKGRDTIVYFIGRNLVTTFLPKEIATLMLDENMHKLVKPMLNNNQQKELIYNDKKEKVFNSDSDMFDFLQNLKD